MATTNSIVDEYDGYDFGFSATDSDSDIVTPQVTVAAPSREGIDEVVQDALAPIHDTLETITNKLEHLENILESGVTDTFDIDGYKALVEKDAKDKLKAVESLIMPLLVNLMKNPDKDTIKWPNRKPIIEKQIERILAITREGK